MLVPFRVRAVQPHHRLFVACSAIAVLIAVTFQTIFYSWEQCWATASGVSNQCLLNRFYVPLPRAVVRRPRTKDR